MEFTGGEEEVVLGGREFEMVVGYIILGDTGVDYKISNLRKWFRVEKIVKRDQSLAISSLSLVDLEIP